jgi:hypothetical protein
MAVCCVSVNGAQVTNTLESRQAMVKNKLTRRGKIVLTIVILAIVWWLLDVTTPEQCKVPVEQMNQFCIDLMYP